MFSEAVYLGRRRALASALAARCGQAGVVLLLGHDDSPYTFAANPYAFRQDSTLLYYTGLAEPGLAVLIDLASGETELVCDQQPEDELIWFTRETPQALAQRCGAHRVISHAALARLLGDLQAQQCRIHHLAAWRPAQAERLAALLGAGAPVVASVELVRCIVAQREVKEATELAQIETALAVSARMHLCAANMAASGVPERAIVNAMTEVVAGAGMRMAYPPICTRDGQVLHHLRHDNTLREGDLLLIDAGAEAASGYASDITRTHCIGGAWRDEQVLMREAARIAQVACADAARPGVPMAHIHRLAAQRLVECLAPLGLFRGSIEAVLESGAYALVFPHGVGHLLGLDVHDMESLGEDLVGYDEQHARDSCFGPNHLRLGKPLREGMTITLEPGVYFIPALWRRWQASGLHRDLVNADVAERCMALGGLRTEDNFVITPSGARRLGPPGHG